MRLTTPATIAEPIISATAKAVAPPVINFLAPHIAASLPISEQRYNRSERIEPPARVGGLRRELRREDALAILGRTETDADHANRIVEIYDLGADEAE